MCNLKSTFHLILLLIIGCNDKHHNHGFTYTPFSKSTIHLTFLNTPSDSFSVDVLAVSNIPEELNDSPSITVSGNGNHYLSVGLDRPTKSILTLGNKQYNIFIIPEDTTHIRVRYEGDEFIFDFSGTSSAMNEYLVKKKTTLGYDDTRIPINNAVTPQGTYSSIKRSTDSITNVELSFLKNYSSTDELPEWFVSYETAEIVYLGAGFKTFLPKYNEMMRIFSDHLPSDYFNYLDSIEIENSNAVYSSFYFMFLGDYFLRDLPFAELKDLSGFKRTNKAVSHQIRNSKKELKGITKELYHKHLFSRMIKFYSDSLQIDSLANELEISNYREFLDMAGSRSRGEIKGPLLKRGDTIPAFSVANELDSLVSIRDFNGQILYLNFWATWCGPCLANVPELNKTIVNYQDDPRIRFVNICIDSEKDKWLATIKRYNIQGINLKAEGSWNSKIRAYFSIKGIPQYAIITKGNILHENFTEKVPQVKSKIDSLLKRNANQ